MLARFCAILAATALAATGLAACATHSPHQPKPSTTATPVEDSWQRTLDRIGTDGRVSTSTALAAFALAIGPVPGAEPPPGPAAAAIPSGTIAVNWVFAHWNDLSGAQRSAVLTDIGGTAQPVGDVVAARAAVKPAPSPNVSCPGASSPDAGVYTDDIPDITNTLAAKLGVTMHLRVYVSINTKTIDSDAGMYTLGCNAGNGTSGRLSACVIHVNPEVTTYPGAEIHLYLLHEMMHCFQFNVVGAAEFDMPAWYSEGSAEWAASVLGTPDRSMIASWTKYLATSEEPTFARSYDGLGFFAQLAAAGDDVWGALMPMARALAASGYSNAAGWNAAGVSPAFLTSWGANFVEGRYPGAPWTTATPNLPVLAPQLRDENVTDGTDLHVTVVRAAAASDKLDITAQVVEVGGGPDGRLSLGGGKDTTLAAAPGEVYCTAGTACTCPPNTPHAGQVFTPMAPGTEYLGVTAGLTGASATVAGSSLADYCKQPTAPCIVGTWLTTDVSGSGPGDVTISGGGAGIRIVITSDEFTADFDGMKPIQISGPQLTAGEVFAGQQRDAAGFSRSRSATSGTITLTDLALAGVTVSFIYPGKGSSAPIKSDSTPISGSGDWTCSDAAMTLHLTAGSNVTKLTLSRVSAQ